MFMRFNHTFPLSLRRHRLHRSQSDAIHCGEGPGGACASCRQGSSADRLLHCGTTGGLWQWPGCLQAGQPHQCRYTHTHHKDIHHKNTKTHIHHTPHEHKDTHTHTPTHTAKTHTHTPQRHTLTYARTHTPIVSTSYEFVIERWPLSLFVFVGSVKSCFTSDDGTFDYVFNCAGETKYGQSDEVYKEKTTDLT